MVFGHNQRVKDSEARRLPIQAKLTKMAEMSAIQSKAKQSKLTENAVMAKAKGQGEEADEGSIPSFGDIWDMRGLWA